MLRLLVLGGVLVPVEALPDSWGPLLSLAVLMKCSPFASVPLALVAEQERRRLWGRAGDVDPMLDRSEDRKGPRKAGHEQSGQGRILKWGLVVLGQSALKFRVRSLS